MLLRGRCQVGQHLGCRTEPVCCSTLQEQQFVGHTDYAAPVGDQDHGLAALAEINDGHHKCQLSGLVQV
jgi:hypothetical protein